MRHWSTRLWSIALFAAKQRDGSETRGIAIRRKNLLRLKWRQEVRVHWGACLLYRSNCLGVWICSLDLRRGIPRIASDSTERAYYVVHNYLSDKRDVSRCRPIVMTGVGPRCEQADGKRVICGWLFVWEPVLNMPVLLQRYYQLTTANMEIGPGTYILFGRSMPSVATKEVCVNV